MAELEDLLVDRAELDRALLSEVLGGYVGIDARTASVVPKEGWPRLSADAKVLVYLLARKAMVALDAVELDVEGALPKEIEQNTGVKGGTLRPKLVKMRDDGVLAQDDAKRYFVPTHGVLRAKAEIEKGRGRDNVEAGTDASRSRRRRPAQRGTNGSGAVAESAILESIPESVSELLATIRSRPHTDRFEAVIFHALRSQGQESVTTNDILVAYTTSRMPKPVNPSDTISKCFRKGHITEGAPQDGEKSWRLTGSGERYIEAVLATAA